MRPLTDLELTVLGNVWKKGNCTAYQVMREFATSVSAYYRSREGAIYPLMSRLEKGGYLRSKRDSVGRRPRRRYSIAPKGLTALQRWLSPPVADVDAMISPDLIRTRVYFLEAVPPAKRRKLIDHVERRLRRELKRNQESLARYRAEDSRFSALAMEGAIAVMQARLDWIGKLRRELSSDATRRRR